MTHRVGDNGRAAVRFRLRFLMQEFDLSEGVTTIGRDTGCHVTIYDPLISRQHARVRCSGPLAEIEDLSSRNGTRVNGSLLQGAQPLKEGDRIRIGAHELVFNETRVGATELSRVTGLMCRCVTCDTVYPIEMKGCPNCGSFGGESEETRPGGDPRTGRGPAIYAEKLPRAASEPPAPSTVKFATIRPPVKE